MSKASDKGLEEAMGRRRPREAIREDVADSILNEMTPGEIVDLPIQFLYRCRFQVRAMASDDEIDKLATSIKDAGLITPVVVRPIRTPDKNLQCKSLPDLMDQPEHAYELVAGHYRVLACIRLGWDTVPALIRSMSDAAAALALTSDNAVKKDLSDFDRFLHIEMLQQTGACKTGRQIASALGVSPSEVTNLRAFGRLPEGAKIILATRSDIIGYRLAYTLTNYKAKSDAQGVDLCAIEPELITQAITRLAAGEIKEQSAVIPWIVARIAQRSPRPFRREVRIQRPNNPPIRISVTDSEAVIKASGIDMEKLQRLLEANIQDLMAKDSPSSA
jgi:ParB family chromosome partitioning protein